MTSSEARANLRHVSNPPNPWQSTRLDWIGPPPRTQLRTYEDQARSILSHNDSPDVPFRWSVNPYRGCFHGCAYCYARPSHERIGLGAGTDFERRIAVKSKAPELLRAAFTRPSWQGEPVVFSGNTDAWQPLEASYGVTRRCLEVCLEFRNPVGAITKAALIERDLDVLQDLARDAGCHVTLSIPFYDPAICRAMEPWAPAPARRLAALRKLSDAGIPVGVNVAPIIPGLNDSDMVRVLEAARDAGAQYAGTILVRLPGSVATVFEERLRADLPMKADRVMNQIRACRSGRLSGGGFGERMRGSGGRWEVIHALFRSTVDRLGLATRPPEVQSRFRRPSRPGQLPLF